jgi:capsid protein
MFQRFRQFVSRVMGTRPKREPVPQAVPIRGSYDAARTTEEFQNAWANADRFDADSAHNRDVRHTLIARSRYEIGSNGFADGIAQTYSTDLIGKGPTLRMLTGSQKFNQLVEATWAQWCKAVKFRRKLWCMAHAKHSDGEAFAVMRRNPRVRHPIPLDLVLYEAEQFQTPYMPFDEPGRIDGIKFDEFGNPQWYDLLREHPGAGSLSFSFNEPERVQANRVLHWFKLRRPGQHRAVPECASTLNTGIASRRFREATLAAAETAAEHAVVVSTTAQPDAADDVRPFTTWDITKRMMNFLPMGWGMGQLKAEHPNATYESFTDYLINEQGRPKSMPLNKIKCNSAQYNYASGRLDHQTYYGQLDVEREDCNDEVLDPLFETWFDLAIVNFGWLGGNPEAVSFFAKAHLWDWPQHAVADIQTEASANETKLRTGETYPSQLYAKQGRDFEDDLESMARDYGVTPEEMRKLLRTAIFNAQNQQASMETAEAQKASASTTPPDNSDLEAGWVTLENGVHIEIGEDGTITKGPNSMRGKTMDQVQRESDTGTWPAPVSKSNSREKLKITDTKERLERQGWQLGNPVPFKPGDKETTYEITHKKTGKKVFKTAKEIREVVSSHVPFEITAREELLAKVNGGANGYAHQ